MQKNLFGAEANSKPARKPVRLTQPIKWHGGKHYLARAIVELMPPHLHYVEPFFGGGSVLLARDPACDWYSGAPDWTGASWQRGCSELVNDLCGELTNFWSVLRSDSEFERFLRKVEASPFSQSVWEEASTTLSEGDSVERAVKFFIRNRQSRQGLGNDFATITRNRTRRRMNEQVSSWLTATEGLAVVHDRLKRVVIFRTNAMRIIKQQDGPRTLFYLDPPYVHQTRTTTGEYGDFEMDEEQHEELLALLSEIEGKFILSGYRHPLYDAAAGRHGWNRVDIQIDNKASGMKSKMRVTECLWINFTA